MIISQSKKFIFFACGKTGTTSLENILLKYHDDDLLTPPIEKRLEVFRKQHNRPFNPKHTRPALVREIAGEEIWSKYFKFVFVRNPWDWVLSNFFFNYPEQAGNMVKFDAEHVNAVWEVLKYYNQSIDSESYFQHTFVLDAQGVKLVDYVGRFESIQQDFNDICIQTGIKPERLPELNVTGHRHYRELYTDQAKDLVARYYAKDIQLFEYDF